jgi:hypothetical protein
MIELQIVDTSFAHDVGTVARVKPLYIKWKRDDLDAQKPVFFCNESLEFLAYRHWNGEVSGLLYESPAILPKVYDLVPTFVDKLKYLYTPNADLMRAYPHKVRYIPGGGVWGSDLSSPGDGITPIKEFLVSMLSSTKTMCGLHEYRLAIANVLRQSAELGSHIFIHRPPDYINPFDTLEKYCFSVVIENHISDNYFTEKLLNCFAVGTIPIYFGARKIDNFFDSTAILQFQSIDQLNQILSKLSFSEWANRTPGIENNKRIANARYRCIEDYLYLNYLHPRVKGDDVLNISR